MSEELVVDARGLRCPAPVIALARAAAGAPAGSVMAVWWTDPAARYDIPAWARMRGHEIIGTAPLAATDPADDTSGATPEAESAAAQDARAQDAPEAHVTEIRLGTRASGA